jgi:hypothetical protein
VSTQSRVRHWLDAHSAAVEDLRSGEIRLAVAIDAIRREASARHADNQDLMQEVTAAASLLADLTTSALKLPKVPDFDGELFFRAACQRWLDVAMPLNTTGGECTFTAADFDQAAQDLGIGRNELSRAIEVLTRAAGRSARPSIIAADDRREM